MPSDILTLQDIRNAKTNALVYTEVLISNAEWTVNVDSNGQRKRTLQYFLDTFTDFLDQSNQTFDTFMSNSNNTFDTFMTTSNQTFDTFMTTSNTTFTDFMSDSNNTFDTFMSTSNTTFDTFISDSDVTFNTFMSASNNTFDTFMSASNATFNTFMSDSGVTFNNFITQSNDAFDGFIIAAQNTINDYENQAQIAVNTAEQAAVDAVTYAQQALISPNYLGEWSLLTAVDSVAQGEYVTHNGESWLASVAISDPTLSEPSATNSDWFNLTSFVDDETYLTANSVREALIQLGSQYTFVDQVLGDKYTYGNDFNDVDRFDELLGKVYDGTATAFEISVVDSVNTKLGLLAA